VTTDSIRKIDFATTIYDRKDEPVADYDITLSEALVPGLLEQPTALAKLLESALNQVLEAQMRDHLGAERYERSDDRSGYRNGTRPRQLYTRVGPITLQVPQTRDGSFSTEIFARYQRSEQAFVLGLMEMVVNGVSTRKVTEITEGLCGATFSKTTVSRLTAALDERVNGFLARRLDAAYPFVIVDALFTKTRTDQRVVSKAALIACGVRADGYRDVLGVAIGDAESFATWNSLFASLRKRGLHGVDYVVSDDHAGLVEAARKNFAGATWQRCQVHLMRNILGHCSSRIRSDVAQSLKNIFNAGDRREAERRRDETLERFRKSASKAMACLEAGFDDAIAVIDLPEKYRKRLRTNNMLERLNQEIRRRERVIRVFPNDESALRMIGALLAETAEDWQERIYLAMDEYHEWRSMRTPTIGVADSAESIA
jgi:putative transposase